MNVCKLNRINVNKTFILFNFYLRKMEKVKNENMKKRKRKKEKN